MLQHRENVSIDIYAMGFTWGIIPLCLLTMEIMDSVGRPKSTKHDKMDHGTRVHGAQKVESINLNGKNGFPITDVIFTNNIHREPLPFTKFLLYIKKTCF